MNQKAGDVEIERPIIEANSLCLIARAIRGLWNHGHKMEVSYSVEAMLFDMFHLCLKIGSRVG